VGSLWDGLGRDEDDCSPVVGSHCPHRGKIGSLEKPVGINNQIWEFSIGNK